MTMAATNAIPFSNQMNLQQFVEAGPLTVFYYTKLRAKSLLVFSIFNFFLWTVSTSLQAFTIAMAHGVDYYKHSYIHLQMYNVSDAAACGIWCAGFYMITGFLGYSTSYTPTRKLLVSTLVFAVFSILASLVAGVVAGLARAYNCISLLGAISSPLYSSNQICYDWGSVERSLMTISFLAGIVNIVVLVLVSMALKAGPQSMSTEGYRVAQPQQDPSSETFFMIQNPVPMIRFPFQVLLQPQSSQQVAQPGQPKQQIVPV